MKAEHQSLAGPLQPLEIPEWKWEEIGMDFITGLPMTPKRKDMIWVIVDRLTKSAHFISVNQKDNAKKLVLPPFQGLRHPRFACFFFDQELL